MKDRDMYRQLAARARADADLAELVNVRERCLRAETAWLVMAERAERTERLRTAHEVAKAHAAAQAAAEAAEAAETAETAASNDDSAADTATMEEPLAVAATNASGNAD